MRIFRAIIVSSLSIPALVFFVFLVTGIIIQLVELVNTGDLNRSWLGMTYAGAVYAYISLLISTLPTIALGYPISLCAEKYGYLRGRVVLIGAAIIGGFFLGIASSVTIEAMDAQLFIWDFIVGAFGGLFNGYIFMKQMKPNIRPQIDVATPRD